MHKAPYLYGLWTVYKVLIIRFQPKKSWTIPSMCKSWSPPSGIEVGGIYKSCFIYQPTIKCLQVRNKTN